MFIARKLVIVACAALLALSLEVALLALSDTSTVRRLSREDLPKGVVFVPHVHPEGEMQHDTSGQPVGEMEHYGTPEAIKNGGHIYGVYGYSIVSIEYEIPESKIGRRMVGKDFSGWGLAPSFFGLGNHIPPYDHFHVGIKDKRETNTEAEKTYLIHFMLLPHAEELEIGLSCG